MAIAPIIAQCTGINAINIYSSEILENVPGIPTTLGTYLLSLANVIGALISLAMTKYFTITTLLIGGQFVMAFFLGCIVLFQLLNEPTMILVSMICMILTFQMTNGSYYFPYVAQVTIEA